VLACFPTAVYLDVDGRVVAVVTADAVRLPMSIVLARPGSPGRSLASDAEPAVVGGGEVRVGALRVTVARWWAPPRPLVAPGAPLREAAAVLSRSIAGRPLDAATATAVADLTRALSVPSVPRSVAHDGALADPVRALVGRGPGLTPTGDDVLAGALVTLRALGEPLLADRLAGVVRSRLPRTTALSASLLECAMDGHALPEVDALVTALAAPDLLAARIGPLLRIGSSSGGDLAHGVLVATRAVCAGRATRLPEEAA
jgi:hypothetical protein